MKLAKRERVIAVAGLITIIGTLYYLCFLSPLLLEMNELKGAIEIEIEKTLQKEELLVRLDELHIEVNRLDSLFLENYNHISVGLDEPLILQYLDEVMQQKALDYDLTFMEPEVFGELKIFRMSISMDTSYAKLLELIYLLEEAPYENQVLAINFKMSKTVENQIDRNIYHDPETEIILGFYGLCISNPLSFNP